MDSRGHIPLPPLWSKRKSVAYERIQKPEMKSAPLEDAVQNWFKESRKIIPESLEYYGVTQSNEWMPQANGEQRVINFNYFDYTGQLANIKYRSANKNFKMFSGGKPILYGLNRVKDLDHMIIVEGEMDCLAIHTAGILGAVSVPSGANKGNNNLNYIENCWEIISSKKRKSYSPWIMMSRVSLSKKNYSEDLVVARMFT